MTRITIALLMLSAFSAAAGQLLFKIGSRNAVNWLDYVNPSIISGLILYGAATTIWIYTLSFAKLVNVYAFTALTFVLVYAGGIALLGERISAVAGVGIIFIILGLYLITNYNA